MRILALLLLLTLSLPAYGQDSPYTVIDPARYTRASGPAPAPATIVGTTTRWLRANGSGTSSPPLCVGWGSLLVLAVSGEVSCAQTMTTTITLGAQDAHTASYLSDDNGADGDGIVDYLPGAGRWDTVVWRDSVTSAPGSRLGVCTGPVAGRGASLGLRYPPCRVDGDCADAGGSGTCNTSPTESQLASSCAFIVCRASAADTQVVPTVQR